MLLSAACCCRCCCCFSILLLLLLLLVLLWLLLPRIRSAALPLWAALALALTLALTVALAAIMRLLKSAISNANQSIGYLRTSFCIFNDAPWQCASVCLCRVCVLLLCHSILLLLLLSIWHYARSFGWLCGPHKWTIEKQAAGRQTDTEVHIHTYTHTHLYTHTPIHTHIYTHTHLYTRSNSNNFCFFFFCGNILHTLRCSKWGSSR